MSPDDAIVQLIHLLEQYPSPLDLEKKYQASTPIQKALEGFAVSFSLNELDELAEGLKERAIKIRRKSKNQAFQLAELIFLLSEITQNKLHKALEHHTKVIIYVIDEKDFDRANEHYEYAKQIYENLNDALRLAVLNTNWVWTLGSRGKHKEAVNLSKQVESVLKNYENWRVLGNLYSILAGIYVVRLGNYEEATVQLKRAQTAYDQLGSEGRETMLSLKFNEAMLLRYLERYQDSIKLNEAAINQAQEWGLNAVVARGKQTLATTNFLIGKFNDAINLLEDARKAFLADEQTTDATLARLSLAIGYLNLGRYAKAATECKALRHFCHQLDLPIEEARATYIEGLAYLKLKNPKEALNLLSVAQECFLKVDNSIGVQESRLGLATALYFQGRTERCLSIALDCFEFFDKKNLTGQSINSLLLATRASMALGYWNLVKDFREQLLPLTREKHTPILGYEIHHLFGQIAYQRGNKTKAFAEYQQAITLIENLLEQIITELRADFLLDKQIVYEELVDLYLAENESESALLVAERAKSRALLTLVTQRFTPHIRLQDREDKGLVDNLLLLRREQDNLRLRLSENLSDADEAGKEIAYLEEKITELWHVLLVRNANYYSQASVWQRHVTSARPYLDEKTAVLEYFSCKGQLLVFLITSQTVQAQWLNTTDEDTKKLHQYFRLNLHSVQKSGQPGKYLANAKLILQRGYEDLFAPVASACANYETLILVPHGTLHYFPLHTLFDGEKYLIEKYKISYLPASSFLQVYKSQSVQGEGAFVLGHSYEGQLPHSISEAKTVSKLLNTKPYIEEAATKQNIQSQAVNSKILHLAAHATFHQENPLFSGISLYKKDRFTTLDMFNIELNASLVTLSACETGRTVVGGGDELAGIMRALLASGAASIILGLWAVEDSSTEALMQTFYSKLVQEQQRKDVSLREAQLSMLYHEDNLYHHPFFWAPFFLVGATGKL